MEKTRIILLISANFYDILGIFLWFGGGTLPDSNITKRALASSLKKLMEAKPLSKISVSDICEACDMNRKSFYYHFKDKYDLVNWIYRNEFIMVATQKEQKTGWDLLEDLCIYFYENHNFYKKLLNVDGQNSFSEYFWDIVVTILSDDMEEIFGRDENFDFYVNFYSDAFVCAMKRWLLEKDCMPAEEFTHLLKNCLLGTSNKIIQMLSPEPAADEQKTTSMVSGTPYKGKNP